MKNRRLACSFWCAILVLTLAVTPQTAFTQEQDEFTSSNPKGCNLCHKPEAGLWLNHGHSKMLRPVENGQAPKGVSVTLPEGMTWNDITYLIGGDKNTARFIDSKGYVMTGQNVQYSLVGKTLTAYMPDVPNGTLKYDCIKCHVVGWKESGSYIKGVKNELEGIPGVWFENSVGCENCHGPGHHHAALGPNNMREMRKKDKKADLLIKIDKTSELCGKCHKRNDNDKINVLAPDLIESRQQYTEMKYNKMAKFKVTCVACHNPHTTSRESKTGFVRQCTDCHRGKFAMPVKIAAMQKLSCQACHMPFADRRSFDSKVQNYTKGDIRSHVFGITVDPNYKLDDGTGHAAIDSNGFVRLTVEMTCFQCHQTGVAPEKSREELLAKAKDVHEIKN